MKLRILFKAWSEGVEAEEEERRRREGELEGMREEEAKWHIRGKKGMRQAGKEKETQKVKGTGRQREKRHTNRYGEGETERERKKYRCRKRRQRETRKYKKQTPRNKYMPIEPPTKPNSQNTY